jgi:hypothetical protein
MRIKLIINFEVYNKWCKNKLMVFDCSFLLIIFLYKPHRLSHEINIIFLFYLEIRDVYICVIKKPKPIDCCLGFNPINPLYAADVYIRQNLKFHNCLQSMSFIFIVVLKARKCMTPKDDAAFKGLMEKLMLIYFLGTVRQ